MSRSEPPRKKKTKQNKKLFKHMPNFHYVSSPSKAHVVVNGIILLL